LSSSPPRLAPVVLAGAAAFIDLYATFYYVGGSVGGSLPALFWSRWGWPACVLLVVAVQLGLAGVSMTFWPGRWTGEPGRPGRGFDLAEM
jgi:hypothetical protein